MRDKSIGVTLPPLFLLMTLYLKSMITQAYKNIEFILYSLILDAMKGRMDTQLVLKTIIFKTKPSSKINQRQGA